MPASGEDTYYTHDEGQTQLYLQVVEGEDEDPDYDTIIGTTMLKLTPRPQGSPIGVSMQYDVNGIIHVRVKDLIDNSDLGEMKIERDANLTDEDVKKKKTIISDINVE